MMDGNPLGISSIATDDLTEGDGLLLLPDGPAVDTDDLRELRLADQR